jgi:hypothetical protein
MMKAKTRNYGVCALMAAVLLAMTMLVTGCAAEPATEAGYQPPAGMGAVQLNFSKTIHRATYLPPDKTLDDFEDVVISFTGPSIVTETIKQNDFATKLSEPIPLTPGTYTLLVVARFTEDDDDSIAAYYADTDIPIFTSNITPIEITLRPFIQDNEGTIGEGTFIWKITNDTGDDDAIFKMVLTNIGDGTHPSINGDDPDISSNLDNEAEDGETLDAGFYYVDITVTANSYTRYFRHILHIYTNMTSTFSYVFTAEHMTLEDIEITLNITYEHPEAIVATWTVEAVTEEDNDVVGGNGTVDTPYILSLSDIDHPKGITFTITNTAPAFDSVSWFAFVAGVATELDTGSSFTVDGTVAPFNVAGGPHQLTVEGLIDGVPHSTEIYIAVVN